MHASAVPAFSMTHHLPDPAWHWLTRLGPLGLVILLHAVFFYALQSGLLQQVAPVVPKEIIAILITPEAPPAAPPQPQPAPVQPVPKPKKPVAKPVAPKPKPSEQAIRTPKAPEPEPAPAEPPVAAAPTPPLAAAPAAATAAAPSTAPAQPKTVTSGVEYLQAPQPNYPALSRRMGEEGTVMLRILVNERGRTDRVEIHQSSGTPRLDEAARQAVLRAVFKPYMENGRPIPVYAILPIRFQLDS